MPEYRSQLYRGWYYAVWTEDGRTKRRALRTQDREEAQRSLVDFERKEAAPAGSTVGQYVQAYLDYKRTRIRHIERFDYAWAAAKATFAALRPDQITPELCDEYTDMRREMGRGDATILKEMNTIRQALNWNKVTTARFEAPSAPEPRDRYLTKEEARSLLDGCSQPHVKLFVLLALTTAGRRSAILSLTWDRVDFARKQIRLAVVGEKNRKGRATVPITEEAEAELLLAKEAAQTAYVIEYAGRPVANVKKGFAAAVARAGLDDVTPHDLRHTAAVWMAEGGVPLVEIAQYLGHSSPNITYKVYSRFSPEYLRGASKNLRF